MDERHDNTNTRHVSSEERSNSRQSNAWVVGTDERDCDHDEEQLRYVGDDGLTTYYLCERCKSVIVTRDPIRRAVRPIN